MRYRFGDPGRFIGALARLRATSMALTRYGGRT